MSGFQEIYENFSRPLYRFLLSLTRDESWAEELLQKTFYRAFLHFDRFEGRSGVYTWLCQIGKNAWLRECRKRERYVCVPREEWKGLASESPSPEAQVMLSDEYARARRAIMDLTGPARASLSSTSTRTYG